MEALISERISEMLLWFRIRLFMLFGGLEALREDDRGVGVVEIILILVVLIALVLIFKTQLTSLTGTIFKTITKNAKQVLK